MHQSILASPQDSTLIDDAHNHQFAYRGLPPELWIAIFVECLPTVPSFSATRAPMLLTHVCRAWRDMALSSQSLWANIALPGPVATLTRSTVRLCKLWLERSKNCPLSVDLHLTSDFVSWVIDVKQVAIVQDILVLIASNSYRLKRLLRVFPRYIASTHKLRLHLRDMPILEELLVRDVHPENGGFFEDFSAINTHLPKSLKSLTLRNTTINLSSFSSLPQLRHLDLWQMHHQGRITPSQSLKILAQLPSLETCGLYISRESGADFGSDKSRKVDLPHLRRLVISGEDEFEVGPMLDVLHTPVLFALGLNGRPSSELWEHLERFVIPCKDTLQELSLGKIGLVDLKLLRCLRQCQPSTHVTVCSCSFDTHLLETLKESRDVGLLPCLSFLSLETWRDFEAMGRRTYLESGGSRNSRGVRLSFCKGVYVKHSSFVETQLAAMD